MGHSVGLLVVADLILRVAGSRMSRGGIVLDRGRDPDALRAFFGRLGGNWAKGIATTADRSRMPPR